MPPFSTEDSANARAWFDNFLGIKECMEWNDDQTNCFGQLALDEKAFKWLESLTLNNSQALSTLDRFRRAFLERFNKAQAVPEVQRLISNLRQSSDEDVLDFFERVTICVMLSFKPI